MKPVLTWVLGSAFLALLLVHTFPAASLATEPITTIATGGINGVYYSAGGAVAKMFNKKRHEFGGWMANQASKGSLENIDIVLAGDVDFGISQANFLYFASNGIGDFEGQQKTNLRAVLGLYIEDLTIIAAMDAEINNAKDLIGKRVNIGVVGSSDEQTSTVVLKRSGVDPADVELFNYPVYEASERLQAGDIDAYVYTVGHPNLSVMEATDGDRKIHIVPFDQNFIDGLAASRPYLSADTRDRLPGGQAGDRKPQTVPDATSGICQVESDENVPRCYCSPASGCSTLLPGSWYYPLAIYTDDIFEPLTGLMS